MFDSIINIHAQHTVFKHKVAYNFTDKTIKPIQFIESLVFKKHSFDLNENSHQVKIFYNLHNADILYNDIINNYLKLHYNYSLEYLLEVYNKYQILIRLQKRYKSINYFIYKRKLNILRKRIFILNKYIMPYLAKYDELNLTI